jgi:hypothetical protein
MTINWPKIREDFPLLHQGVNRHPLVYLDNAAVSGRRRHDPKRRFPPNHLQELHRFEAGTPNLSSTDESRDSSLGAWQSRREGAIIKHRVFATEIIVQWNPALKAVNQNTEPLECSPLHTSKTRILS